VINFNKEITMNMCRIQRFSFLLLILVLIAGCAQTGKTTTSGADQDFLTNSYNGLKVSAVSVDGAMKTIASLYTSGKISEDVKAQVITAYDKFKLAYADSTSKLSVYSITPTDATKTAATTAIANVGIQVAAIIALSVVQ